MWIVYTIAFIGLLMLLMCLPKFVSDFSYEKYIDCRIQRCKYQNKDDFIKWRDWSDREKKWLDRATWWSKFCAF